jgi:hypothetical protein
MVAQHPPVVSLPAAKAQGGKDVCPTCGQPVTHLKFAEIKAHLAAQEREHAVEMQRQIAAGIGAAKATIESAAQAKVAQAKASALAEAQAQIAKFKKDVAAQISAARAETKQQVEAVLHKKIEAGEAATKKLAALEATHAKELSAQRIALEKAGDKIVRAEKARAFRETQRLQATVATLQRRLEHKTADERGEGAEVDVFETLQAAFPTDKFRRVKKGEPGADIVHEVVRNGRICGTIVYDSKDREAWRNEYVAKLKADQLAAGADHAMLVTRVFPEGLKQLAVRDGIVILNPARVVTIAQLLRGQIEQADTLRLSRQARDEKAARLYSFITSEQCAQLFERIESQAQAMLELDVTEKKAHDKTWNTRGSFVLSIERARAILQLEIERIIGTAGQEQSA